MGWAWGRFQISFCELVQVLFPNFRGWAGYQEFVDV
jgi:hypothetical protein